jgi:OOP family OmpA-OmpF porin
MKKNLLLVVALFSFSIYAQEDSKKASSDLEIINGDAEVDEDYYNRWSVEFDLGQSKGAKPYTEGYYSSEADKFFGGFQINHYGLGLRYMLNPKFGIKGRFAYDDIKNLNGSESLKFKLQHYQFSFEAVVNAIRLFDIQDNARRMGLLFHFGIQASQMSPISNEGTDGLGTTTNGVFTNDINANKGKKELNGGLVVGLTPSVRVFNNLSLFLDIAINSNIRQHFNWDGASYSERNNNLTGGLYTTSFGLSYSFGKAKIHGDWAIIKEANNKRIDSLNARIGEIETLMNDSDKDGVPDYLDAEQNSINGVAVDTKGRMVDRNDNGVPDELERYVSNSITKSNEIAANAATENAVLELINKGYIAAYFDSGKSKTNSTSASSIGFILTYLKNNPSKSVEISGYADEIGNTNSNNKLALDRAENVKTLLLKAGISESRISVESSGVDSSVDKNSDAARQLVRKVIFKIK